ncbi:MAG: flagellar brake protein [Gammaproteobacteria bacterium]|nr:MAG: flagellar brake protein [Gammaproteobacteria bacterium]
MFAPLNKVFSKVTTIEDTAKLSTELDTNPYFVTTPAKVLQIIKAIEAESSFCTIELGNSGETYTSRIIDVQEDKKLLSIDELIPAPGNEKLEQCKQLKLTTYLNNIHLSIALKDVSSNIAEGIIFYQAPLPKRIFYPQRRNHPRVAITAHKLSFQGISDRTDFTVGGTVFDISRNGISIIIDTNIARIQRGDQLNNCILTLPNRSNIHFDLIIRVIKPYNEGHSQFLVGGYFSQLKSTKQQKQLEQFYALVERSEIRKQKDY